MNSDQIHLIKPRSETTSSNLVTQGINLVLFSNNSVSSSFLPSEQVRKTEEQMLTSVISLVVTKEKLKTHTKTKLTEDISLKKKSLKTICKCVCSSTIIFFLHVRKAEEGRVMERERKVKRERREERKKTEGERDQLIPEWRI